LTRYHLSFLNAHRFRLTFECNEQINSKFTKVGTKEIKKVAEARMRKRKRAMNKLKAAKRQANALAENSELSEKQKLKVEKMLYCSMFV
jgi:hypothetical protein